MTRRSRVLTTGRVRWTYYPFYPSDKGHVLLAFGL